MSAELQPFRSCTARGNRNKRPCVDPDAYSSRRERRERLGRQRGPHPTWLPQPVPSSGVRQSSKAALQIARCIQSRREIDRARLRRQRGPHPTWSRVESTAGSGLHRLPQGAPAVPAKGAVCHRRDHALALDAARDVRRVQGPREGGGAGRRQDGRGWQGPEDLKQGDMNLNP